MPREIWARTCQWSHVLGMGHDLRHRQTNVIGARTQRPQVLIQSKLLCAPPRICPFLICPVTPHEFLVFALFKLDAAAPFALGRSDAFQNII